MVSITKLIFLTLLLILAKASSSMGQLDTNTCSDIEPPEVCTVPYVEALRNTSHGPPGFCAICCASFIRLDCINSKCGDNYNTEWDLTIPENCTEKLGSKNSSLCWPTEYWVVLGTVCVIAFALVAWGVRNVVDKLEEGKEPAPAPEPAMVKQKKKKRKEQNGVVKRAVVVTPESEPQPGPSRHLREHNERNMKMAKCTEYLTAIAEESRIPMIDDSDSDEHLEMETKL